MKYIKPFENLRKEDVLAAGGKGASLGEMTNAGIPVPPGYVILSSAFDTFLSETGIQVDVEAILAKTHHDVMHEVERSSEEIQEIILSQEFPQALREEVLSSFKDLNAEFVAVRSSATAEDGAEHAWAGQLDTFLNTTEEHVLENIKKCWASLFTPRAIFYRFEKGLAATHISVAVVVQRMVDSEYAGIAFSVHPVTEDRNQMIIEAGFGLGEAIVSGQVTPDSYVITKSSRQIIDVNVSEQPRALYRMSGGGNEWRELGEKEGKQVLTKEEILELSDIITRIENHYGFPCDIEWAYEGGKFYITQSRPITTLSGGDVSESEPPIVLEKSFTRERPLFYYYAFPDADKAGIQKYLGRDIDDILFIIQPKGMPGEVWYPQKAFEELSNLALERLNSDKDLRDSIARDLDAAWAQISPYFLQGKEIETKEEAFVYYQYVIDFWMALNTLFFCLVDNPHLHKEFSEKLKSVRDGTQEYTALMSEKFVTYFEKAFPEYAHVSHYITPTEVRDLERNDSQLMAILEERSRVGCFVYRDVLYLLPELDDVAQKNNLLLKQESTDSATEVKGQTAFKGKVRGLVKVVRRRADLEKVKEGDILVSPITDANYVPAMQRSAAFVTDEGGVMCHAAIVARELKKPCIIGTKVGTQVLKDGDLVEVDADSGVVKILEKKKVIFRKKYSRDTSLFMQGLWAKGLSAYAIEKYGWHNPHVPLVAHYAHDGFIDIYEHEEAVTWLIDTIQKEIKKDASFLEVLLKEYESQVSQLKEIHLTGLRTKEDREIYSTLIYQAMFSMTIFFYIGPDKRSSEESVKMSVHARELADLFADNDYFIRREISRIGNVPEELSSLVLAEELEKIPTIEILQQRVRGCMVVDGVIVSLGTVADAEKASSTYAFAQALAVGDLQELKGQIAQKGVVQGVVRIVRKQNDMAQVQQGDILVSSMTTPDFLPAMNKAAAFVTDEGGITCHAAIVARELKKPCIIGTEFATQVLKDGDLVEVNADEGVVRVLDRVINRNDFSLNFSAEGVQLLFSDINVLTYSPSTAVEFTVGTTYSSYYANACLNEMHLRAKGADFYELLQAKAVMINKAVEKISQENLSSVEKLSKEHVMRVIGLFQEVARGFGFYNNGYLDGFFNSTVALEYPDKVTQVGVLKNNLREKVNAVFFEPGCPYEVMLKNIERQFSVLYNDLTFYRVEEVYELFDGKRISSEEIAARKTCFLFIKTNDRLTFFSGKVAHARVEAFYPEVNVNDNELQGTIANPGQYVGRVRNIVTDYSNFAAMSLAISEMQEGEVLVSQFTAPELMPALVKAGAIVTDLGGLLSHAAITSRELNKPCVIGTGVASKVLKTGDLVEVDADSGVVKIL